MRRPGDGLVVLGGSQHDGHRAADLDQRRDPPYGRGRGAVVAADRPRAAGEQVGRRGERAGAARCRPSGGCRHSAPRPGDRTTSASGAAFTLPTSVTTVSSPAASSAAGSPRRDGRAARRRRPGERLVAGFLRAAGAQPRRGAEMLGGRVRQEYVDARPSARQRDRGTDQAGTDHLDRAGQEATRRGVHRHAARLGDRRPERPGPTGPGLVGPERPVVALGVEHAAATAAVVLVDHRSLHGCPGRDRGVEGGVRLLRDQIDAGLAGLMERAVARGRCRT